MGFCPEPRASRHAGCWASSAERHRLVEQAVFSTTERWEEFLFDSYGAVAQDFAARTASGMKQQIAIETKADPPIEDRWLRVVADWLGQQAAERVRQIQAGTLAFVRRVLQQGAEQGEGIPTIARRLAAAEPAITAARAVTIARTEVIAASNLGARAGAISTGLDLARVDRHPRPSHPAGPFGRRRPGTTDRSPVRRHGATADVPRRRVDGCDSVESCELQVHGGLPTANVGIPAPTEAGGAAANSSHLARLAGTIPAQSLPMWLDRLEKPVVDVSGHA